MNTNLSGKTAFISGSTAGIGLAVAIGLAKMGATVIVNGRTSVRVEEAVKAVQAQQPKAAVRGFAADLSTAAGAEKLFSEVPTIDILVNNLGIFAAKDFYDITDADWMNMFDVNVMSGIRLSRFYLPKMIEKNWGRIVFISSESGVNQPAEMLHYGMTKTCQLAIARGLAEMTKGTGVTVNSVLPGPTMTEGVQKYTEGLGSQSGKSKEQLMKEFFEEHRPTSLLQRFLTEEEVANMVCYVCSPASSGTNGASLRVEGGLLRNFM